jgi:hypothetical protein
MEPTASEERQVRAARNQSLFRALNEKLSDMNESLSSVSQTFVIACECADTSCVEMLDINPDEYRGVRADPRWFVVLPGHVYQDVESVTRELNGYVVVEKLAVAGEVAEETASANDE